MVDYVTRILATPAKRTSAGYVVALIYCIFLALIFSPDGPVANATAVAYGAVVIHDLFFTLVAVLNLVCCAAVTAVGVQRWRAQR